MRQVKILLIFIIGIFIIYFSYNYYNKMQNINCYKKCADYHLSGESSHWNFVEYVIDRGDTIWIDLECYNDWCICMDECIPGLCCERLR